jgi:branched-chain amino acid transport system substrate-binding protein
MKGIHYLTGCLLIGMLAFSFAASAQKNYGNTPDEFLPYGKFQVPYKWVFAEPQLYLGPGRSKPEPAGLKEVRIGFLGPLQGAPETPMGIQMLNGATLAMEEANANGGFRGLPFVMMKHNDVGLWGAAANEVVKMYDEGAWAMLGSIDDINTHVALRVALKLEIPIVNTGDPDPTLTETKIPWAIRVLADDRQLSYALARHMHQEKGIKRVVVMRQANRYGRVGTMEYKDAAQRVGCPPLFELQFAIGDTDFTPQLERMKKANPEAILIWGNPKECGLVVKQIRAMGMKQPIYGCSRMVLPEFIEIAGKDAEGIVIATPENPTLNDPKYLAFKKKYIARFGLEPDYHASHAYDGMNILVEAIRIAGLNHAKIRDVLLDLKTFQYYKGVTGEKIFDATWTNIAPVWLAQMKQGKYGYWPSPIEKPVPAYQ